MDVIRFCVLVGSARPSGNAPGMAKWVHNQLKEVLNKSSSQIIVTVVDPYTKPHPVNPVSDEKIPAAIKNSTDYTSEEVRDWSHFIQSCNALIVVTPQYNWGYPSTLKLALDVLYAEWRQKPVAVVTYGGHGGTKCDEQLRQVMTGLKMDIVEQRVQVTLPEQYVRSTQRVIPSDETDCFLEQYKESLQLALNQLIDKIQK